MTIINFTHFSIAVLFVRPIKLPFTKTVDLPAKPPTD